MEFGDVIGWDPMESQGSAQWSQEAESRNRRVEETPVESEVEELPMDWRLPCPRDEILNLRARPLDPAGPEETVKPVCL